MSNYDAEQKMWDAIVASEPVVEIWHLSADGTIASYLLRGNDAVEWQAEVARFTDSDTLEIVARNEGGTVLHHYHRAPLLAEPLPTGYYAETPSDPEHPGYRP